VPRPTPSGRNSSAISNAAGGTPIDLREAVTGKTVAPTRVYYGFSDGASDRVVLADRARAGSVVLRRADGTELPAVLAGGTVLITAPGLTAPRERGTVTDRVVVRDPAGTVVEGLPYQQQP